MNNKLRIIITIIMLCIIIAGVAVTCIWGLNFDLIYSNNNQISVYIGKNFEVQDIENIAKEVLNPEKIIVQKVELYEDIACITIKEDVTQEQLTALNDKINEKYELENTVENNIIVNSVANVRGRDLIKPYILPILISFILIIVYMLIYMILKYKAGKKVNIVKDLVENIISIILVQIVYLSLIAILRIPINRLTIPSAIILYIITTIILMCRLEKKYKSID